MKQSLFDQGYLDEQFVELEELQDDANPNFVEEVVASYYRDSARLLLNIEQALERKPLDLMKLDNYMHQFKGSSSRCKRTFQQLKKEYAILRKKLEVYFQFARQAEPVDKACRPK
ncbi:UNVERIFIED_CONTAM: Histidine-containing phosphotransfer protein 4 [Sesamum radiatum]|uniref:Histidine-containing phosphotransfer protein n=1 Tax=Sesamum radiatum TaxID=300843 RepID=A0AAW2V7J4_SESRA